MSKWGRGPEAAQERLHSLEWGGGGLQEMPPTGGIAHAPLNRASKVPEDRFPAQGADTVGGSLAQSLHKARVWWTKEKPS